MPDEAAFEPGAALFTAVTGGTALFQRPLLKRHLVAENEFSFPKSLSYV